MTAIDIDEPVVAGMLPGLQQRVPELGRIRMGDKSEKGFPIRLRTFRLTSHSKTRLDECAALYGGTVEAWKDAPNEGMWELTTERDELDVLVPAMFNVVSQGYEFWQGGTCERRCDGAIEQISGQDCLCAAEGLEGPDRLCDIVTRLRVMLPRVSGLGVWRLDTQGYFAATSLPATIQLLARLQPGGWIPAILRAEQRSSKARIADPKPGKPTVETHRFVVPVIDLPGTTIGQIVGGQRNDTPPLEEGEKPRPPTAAERAAERRAQIEAQAGGSEVTLPVDRSQAGVPASTQAPAVQTGSICPVKSPRGVACEITEAHTEHRRGNVSWPTPKQAQTASGIAESQEHGRPAGVGEPVADEAAAGVVTAPAADLVEAARQEFGDDIAEGEFRQADPIPPDVQAGLDLIPPSTPVRGR